MKKSKKYLQVSVVANRLSCSRDFVYELIKNGKLKAINLKARAWRISEESYNDFIKKAEVNPAELDT